MNFSLDFTVKIDDAAIDSTQLLENLDRYREQISDIRDLEGTIVIKLESQVISSDIFDPLIRLADHWSRAIPWVIGGDTETIALRNSEHCFGFVPTGESVELSFFSGTELEVEDYIIEPTKLRLKTFVESSLQCCDYLVELIKAIDESLLETHEDCRDFITSLSECRKAWRDHEKQIRR